MAGKMRDAGRREHGDPPVEGITLLEALTRVIAWLTPWDPSGLSDSCTPR
jgi:hypothetical protein